MTNWEAAHPLLPPDSPSVALTAETVGGTAPWGRGRAAPLASGWADRDLPSHRSPVTGVSKQPRHCRNTKVPCCSWDSP